MKGTTLHSPYSDSNFDKPSQKTDLLVEQALKNLSDKEMSSLHDTKSSLNSLRSFSGVEQHVSDKKFSYEEVYRLEEEIKEKNNIIKELQANNNELAKLNIRLTKELELTIDKYEKISVRHI
jgi:cell shape-determining protein MreC